MLFYHVSVAFEKNLFSSFEGLCTHRAMLPQVGKSWPNAFGFLGLTSHPAYCFYPLCFSFMPLLSPQTETAVPDSCTSLSLI